MKTRRTALLLILVLAFTALMGCGAHEHEWSEATCTEPATCSVCGLTEGEALGHDWQEATCLDPKTCAICGETEGEPGDHTWQEATCQAPKTCTVCGETEGESAEHQFEGGDELHANACALCGELEPMELPASGTVLIGNDLARNSVLTIKSSSDVNYYIKLKDADGNDVFAFFVRAGESVDVDVPGGVLTTYFACGDTWYGIDACFGEDTEYSMDEESTDFDQYTCTYTLYPVEGGNFSDTPIDPAQFQ